MLKKIWEGLKAPVKEHGGTLSFIQASTASTPGKERSYHRELTRLEEARERARKEVKQLLAGSKEQELENKLEEFTDEISRLEEAVKQLVHEEAMGKEVIQVTSSDIQQKQTTLEKMTKLWAGARERLRENKSDQELRKYEEIKRNDKDIIGENIRTMTNIIKEEEKKVEDLKKKTRDNQERIEELQGKRKGIQHELDKKLQENKDQEERQSKEKSRG